VKVFVRRTRCGRAAVRGGSSDTGGGGFDSRRRARSRVRGRRARFGRGSDVSGAETYVETYKGR
jgi:hypothetical protein